MYSPQNTADVLRNIPLENILQRMDAEKDRYDNSKWHTAKGVISITGQKFFNWSESQGGGGAIDLAIHLRDFDFQHALQWLQQNFPSSHNSIYPLTRSLRQKFVPPKRDTSKTSRIIQYLHLKRCVPKKLIYALIRSGKLYADNRQNAVFLLLGKEKIAVGAELVGTTSIRWRGMAPGSRKNLGAFSFKIGLPDHIVLCESAIDALSYCSLHTDCMAISTSGVVNNPDWLPEILAHGMKVFCGFDSDEAGECMARKLMQRYPDVHRLRPTKKDWNEVLKSFSSNELHSS